MREEERGRENREMRPLTFLILDCLRSKVMTIILLFPLFLSCEKKRGERGREMKGAGTK